MPIAEHSRVKILLGFVVLVGILAGARFTSLMSPAAPAAPAPPAAVPAPRHAPQRPEVEVPVVRLDALEKPRPEEKAEGRNPFRFEAGSAEAGSGTNPGGERGHAVTPPQPVQPAGPAPPPPIPLRFIGILGMQPGRPAQPAAGRIAILSDGHNVFYGREGEVLDGRFRLVRIGLESVEIGWVDQPVTQTIPFTGSGARP